MRTIVILATALSLAACTTTRSRGDAGSADEPMAGGPMAGGPAVVAPAPMAAAAGPMDAAALARETGMQYQDLGSSVLLSGSDVRARFFPGNDRVSIDGNSKPMGAAARRDGTSFLVPPSGVDVVRQAVRDAAARRVATAASFPKLTLPPVAVVRPPPSLKPVNVPSAMAARRGGTAPDPSWTSFTGPERPWKWIVIHHSDDFEGCCAKYDRVHRDKGWDCCGYHWVVGNGTQSGDGEVEIGPRWRDQMHGAHAKTPDNRYNDYGIGVVLVGDFERGGRPTARQYEATVALTRWLMARYGISADRVLRHSDCKSTACPGKNFPWSKFLADVAN
jgi:hypothetical protein